MSSLCIVPARSGSKRLPGKNSKILGDKQLIYHTLDKAVEVFTKVLFTSDDPQLLQDVSEMYSGGVWTYSRPLELCGDSSKVAETVSYYHKKFSDLNQRFESIWLSLPTCPFKTLDDFRNCRDFLDETDSYQSIISVCECDFPPTLSIQRSEGGEISSWIGDNWEVGNSRSQDHSVLYRPNGAIYGTRWDDFSGNFYSSGRTYGYIMDKMRSLDIDTESDFEYAKYLYERKLV